MAAVTVVYPCTRRCHSAAMAAKRKPLAHDAPDCTARTAYPAPPHAQTHTIALPGDPPFMQCRAPWHLRFSPLYVSVHSLNARRTPARVVHLCRGGV